MHVHYKAAGQVNHLELGEETASFVPGVLTHLEYSHKCYFHPSHAWMLSTSLLINGKQVLG